jgi:hypothetical protein
VPIPFTAIRACLDLRPILRPLFAPREWSPASSAGLSGQIGFQAHLRHGLPFRWRIRAPGSIFFALKMFTTLKRHFRWIASPSIFDYHIRLKFNVAKSPFVDKASTHGPVL